MPVSVRYPNTYSDTNKHQLVPPCFGYNAYQLTTASGSQKLKQRMFEGVGWKKILEVHLATEDALDGKTVGMNSLFILFKVCFFFRATW